VIAVVALRRVVLRGCVELEAEPALDLGEELLRGPAMIDEQELHPRLRAVDAQLVRVAEDRRDRLDDQSAPARDARTPEQDGEMRLGGESAADAHVEADHAVGSTHRRHADVVDLRIRAPVLRSP
jgi:hypothetical protein